MIRLQSVALFSLLVIGPALADTHNRADVTSTSVIAANGKGGYKLAEGDNPLDQAAQFNCASGAGCLVTIQAMSFVGIAQAVEHICSMIDGLDASPKCPIQSKTRPVDGAVFNSLQTMDVTTGDHTVQTFLRVHIRKGFAAPKLGRWQVIYTIYRK